MVDFNPHSYGAPKDRTYEKKIKIIIFPGPSEFTSPLTSRGLPQK